MNQDEPRKAQFGLRQIPRGDDSAQKFMQLAWDEGWFLRSRQSGSEEERISYELIYEDTERKAWIYYIEDCFIDIPYISVHGSEHARSMLGELIAKRLDVWSNEELFRAWDEAATDEEAAMSLLYLGVAAPPEYAAPFFDRMAAALCHPSIAVRKAAVIAAAYRCWADFKPLLETMHKSDSSEEVRELYAAVLGNWEEHAGKP